MSDDPYAVLGVGKDATPAEIKQAYRKLAKALHPDLSPGDSTKAAQFQRVNAANDILSDPEKRRRFDEGEIDAGGQERPQQRYYRQEAASDAGRRYNSTAGYEDFAEASDIFADLFGQRARAGAGFGGPGGPGPDGQFSAPGADRRYHLDVDFMDAALGADRAIPFPDGQTIRLTIPAGVRDGQTLRLRGQGGPGLGGGPPGDAYVEIAVGPHQGFVRDGNDIVVEVPITFDEAVLGGTVEVPTIHGPVSMKLPKGASSGRRLRLKGKGIQPARGVAGDQHVRLRIVLPEKIDATMEAIAAEWRSKVHQDPRKGGAT